MKISWGSVWWVTPVHSLCAHGTWWLWAKQKGNLPTLSLALSLSSMQALGRTKPKEQTYFMESLWWYFMMVDQVDPTFFCVSLPFCLPRYMHSCIHADVRTCMRPYITLDDMTYPRTCRHAYDSYIVPDMHVSIHYIAWQGVALHLASLHYTIQLHLCANNQELSAGRRLPMSLSS